MDSAVATNRKAATVGFMSAGVLVGIALKVLVDSAAAITTGGLGQFLAQDFFLNDFCTNLRLSSFLLFVAASWPTGHILLKFLFLGLIQSPSNSLAP